VLEQSASLPGDARSYEADTISPELHWGSVRASELIVDNYEGWNHRAMREPFRDRVHSKTKQESFHRFSTGKGLRNISETIKDMVSLEFKIVDARESVARRSTAGFERIFEPLDESRLPWQLESEPGNGECRTVVCNGEMDHESSAAANIERTALDNPTCLTNAQVVGWNACGLTVILGDMDRAPRCTNSPSKPKRISFVFQFCLLPSIPRANALR
jgi:hypothetical protein